MPVTQEQIDRIKTLDLKVEECRQALAGFLCNAVQEMTHGGVYLGPQLLDDAIHQFVKAHTVNVGLPERAAEIVNKKKRR
jgi:hypothetical protein